MKKDYKRKTYIINKSFQGRFVLRFIVPAVIGSLLAVILFNILAYKKIDAILYSMKMPTAFTSNIIFKEIVYANIFAAIIITVILFFSSTRLLYRIKHSLNRIRVEIMKVTHGDLRSKINLRGKDEFKDLADKLNRMVAELNYHFSDIKNLVDNMSELAVEIEKTKEKHNIGEISKYTDSLIDNRLSKLISLLDSLEEKIKAFEK